MLKINAIYNGNVGKKFSAAAYVRKYVQFFKIYAVPGSKP